MKSYPSENISGYFSLKFFVSAGSFASRNKFENYLGKKTPLEQKSSVIILFIII
jgi:hypothetical protein